MRNPLKIIWWILTAPFRFIRWVLLLIGRGVQNAITNIHTILTEEIEDEPLPETFAKTVQNPMGVLEHLNELRIHLFRSVAALAVTTVISFVFARDILNLMASPVGGIDALIAIDPTEPIGVFMRIALLSGFTLALPYIAFELWLFVAPGLMRSSRLFSLAAIPVASLFFVGGMAFAYFIMLPAAIPFLINFMGINTQLRPASYVRFVTGVMFWLGVSFEFPLVIYVLARIGIVHPRALRNQWRLAIVIIAIAAAMITPTIDPVNMGLVMGPLVLLYFLSIGLAYIARRGRDRALST